MNIRPDQLAAQYEGARARWPFLHDYEREYGLPTFLLFAVGSREVELEDAFAHGETGDGGHGHGVFQLDDRWHTIPSGFDHDIHAQARKAAEMLAGLHADEGDWQRALNRYNSGSPNVEDTTGRDYGPDVWERREWLAANYSEGEAPVSNTTGWRALDEVVAAFGLRYNPPVGGQAYRPGGDTWHGVEPGGHARDYGLIDADADAIAELFAPLAQSRSDLIPETFGSNGVGFDEGQPYQAPGHTGDHTHVAIRQGVTAGQLLQALNWEEDDMAGSAEILAKISEQLGQIHQRLEWMHDTEKNIEGALEADQANSAVKQIRDALAK